MCCKAQQRIQFAEGLFSRIKRLLTSPSLRKSQSAGAHRRGCHTRAPPRKSPTAPCNYPVFHSLERSCSMHTKSRPGPGDRVYEQQGSLLQVLVPQLLYRPGVNTAPSCRWPPCLQRVPGLVPPFRAAVVHTRPISLLWGRCLGSAHQVALLVWKYSSLRFCARKSM